MAGMDLTAEPYTSNSDNEPDPTSVTPSSDHQHTTSKHKNPTRRCFVAEPSAEPVVLDPNSSSSSSPLKAIRYRECMRNHAASIGGHANDGCGEFMASGRDGSPASLSCAACGCHRNFHRREVTFPSAAEGGCGGSAVPPPPQPLLLHHQPHHHHGRVYHQMSAAPIKSAPPHLQRQLTMLSQNTVPVSGTKWAQQLHFDKGADNDDNDNDDDCDGNVGGGENMDVDYDRTPERDEVMQHHHNHHHHHHNSRVVGIMPTMASPVTTMMRGKRFRTKFTQDQKERMLEFAERLGWRLQRHDDVSLNQFCAEIGVTRNVFKVWMHNNKNLHRPRPTTAGVVGDFGSPSSAPPSLSSSSSQMIGPASSAPLPPQSVGV